MADRAADENFMWAALAEARKGIGRVSPNPAVGAVLVRGGRIIASGFHRGRGLPHAEIECLVAASSRPLQGSTLYVTLEPCSTTGHTPPCTEAIIRAGVNRIVIGAIDPNPLHSGRGIEQLARAGIEVTAEVLPNECARLNEGFNKWIATGQPFVIAKCGMSLDGRLTRPLAEGQWLTSPAARRHARQLRAQVDAVLIGAETLRHDNPRLTARGFPGARQPLRVILSRSGNLPREAHVFTDRFAARTLAYRRKSLRAVLNDLGRREVTSVLIEGGGEILGEAFDLCLVDKVQFYFAPLLCGGPVFAVGGKGAATTAGGARLTSLHHERIGSDLCLTGYPRWGEQPA